jgi:alkyl hydroperoxide reductase subunit F
VSLDQEIKNQLAQYLDLLEENIILGLSVSDDENSKKVSNLVLEIAEMSPKISVKKQVNRMTPSFTVDRESTSSGISFAGLPLGHEFTSLVLALLQVSGRAPKIDEELVKQIKAINQPLHFETYVSLTCQNCPDVVQAFNIMSVLNPNISHTMIEGGMFKEVVEAKNILAVPTVYLNGEEFSSGRMSLEQILEKVAG